MADLALEVLRDDKSPKRRIIRGYGRIVAVPELCYEMAEDGTLVPLGDPEELALEQVKERALSLLTEEWQSLKDIMSAMGEPRPSEEQVRRALNDLVEEGRADRDPPLGTKGNKAHRWRLAASPFPFDGHTFNRNETEPVGQASPTPFRFNGQSINRNETKPVGQVGPAPPTDPLAQGLAEAFEPKEDEPPTQDPPPPLPPDIRPVCPRCGSVGELVRTKCYCPACFLIFSPLHIPKWALEVFWEEAAQGVLAQTPDKTPDMWAENFGRNPGQNFRQNPGHGNSGHAGQKLRTKTPDKTSDAGAQNSGHGETPDTKTPDTKTSDTKTSDKTPDKGRGNPGQKTPDNLCEGCGRPLAKPRRGPPPKWCGDSCRKRYRRSQGGPTNGERC
jgi:hypothetical protein